MSAAPSTGALSPIFSGMLSLLFWASLLTAAVLYAGVALAPKLVAWQEYDRQCREIEWELISLESRTTQLQQVIAALQNDPEFAAELIRQEFNARVPGEEVIPVSDPLSFQVQPEAPVPASPLTHGRWEEALTLLATHQPLRRGLLASAAGLVILSFTFLHDHGAAKAERRSLLECLRDRYAANGTASPNPTQ